VVAATAALVDPLLGVRREQHLAGLRVDPVPARLVGLDLG
jgi:hypothetical protein